MANEAQVRSSLNIRKGSLNYQSQPTAFTVDVDTAKGPTPGALTIDTVGTDVDLSQLDSPGLCRLMNLDTVNHVEYGIWDPELLLFYPLGEVGPGESYILKLSRNLAQEYGTGPGTGAVGAETNRLRLRAYNAACVCLIEAFER